MRTANSMQACVACCAVVKGCLEFLHAQLNGTCMQISCNYCVLVQAQLPLVQQSGSGPTTAHGAVLPGKAQQQLKLPPAIQPDGKPAITVAPTSGSRGAQPSHLPIPQVDDSLVAKPKLSSRSVSAGKGSAGSGGSRIAKEPVSNTAVQTSLQSAKAAAETARTAAKPSKSQQSVKQAVSPPKVYAKRTPPQPAKQALQAAIAVVKQKSQQSAPAQSDTPAQAQTTSSKAASAAVPAPSMKESQVDDALTDDTKFRQRQPSEGASDSDPGGVAFQSGYHMSDSPVLLTTTDEEEEPLAESALETFVEHPPDQVAEQPASAAAVTNKVPSTNVMGKAHDSAISQSAASARLSQHASAIIQQAPAQTPAAQPSTAAPITLPISSHVTEGVPVSPPAKSSGAEQTINAMDSPAAKQTASKTASLTSARKAKASSSRPATPAQAKPPDKGAKAPQNQVSEVVSLDTTHTQASGKASGQLPPSGNLQQPSEASKTQPSQNIPADAAVRSSTQLPVKSSADAAAVIPGLADDKAAKPGLHSQPVTVMPLAGQPAGPMSPTVQPDATKSEKLKSVTKLPGESKPHDAVFAVRTAPVKSQSLNPAGPSASKFASMVTSLPKKSSAAVTAAADTDKMPAASTSALKPVQTVARQQPAPHLPKGKEIVQQGFTFAQRPESVQQPYRLPSSSIQQGQPGVGTTSKGFHVPAEPSSPKAQPFPHATTSPLAALHMLSPVKGAPLPRASVTTEVTANSVAEDNPPLPSSDSGESMEIDDEDDRPVPPLPNGEAKPEQLQLATIASSGSMDEVALSAGYSQDKLERLSQIEVSC